MIWRAGSQLKYLVLDAILGATERGGLIATPVDPAAPRIARLPAGKMRCFN